MRSGCLPVTLARLFRAKPSPEPNIIARLNELEHLLRVLLRNQQKGQEEIMATLDTLAGQVQTMKGDAAAEAVEVKAKIDELSALIVELQANTNDPVKVQEISDSLGTLQADIKAIFTGA